MVMEPTFAPPPRERKLVMISDAESIAASAASGDWVHAAQMLEAMMWSGASSNGSGVADIGGSALASPPASSNVEIIPASDLYASMSVLFSSVSNDLNFPDAASRPLLISVALMAFSPSSAGTVSLPSLRQRFTPSTSISSMLFANGDIFKPVLSNASLISFISSSILPTFLCTDSRTASSMHSNASLPFLSHNFPSAPAARRSLTHWRRRECVSLKDWKVPRMAQWRGVMLAI
mmetsp:Transcript_5312/g.9746  ORF Transcript_5312/g.9746 Transcript_5312/m.9746 type:complete len:234 (+) Transcript_5312:370-1071(+)